ncbi:tRNA (guanine(46)-N(7))-methyltransferase TrmB [Aureimonas pseudogalii]|uniref:tRNA (guanine-N(7)-)-methyltransferase n=1 Tax=Aureimonas pseudogalii TaxID=1744844 RepID=A0A7W6H497_9HYPH|nr:tRNA (guanine(46)-N(7))-methyltransferase TrmB [Aureimonas pseudogalii]MBB3997803.1 tRNA (guanine-N7-)-methyltransferase [Aureimonas pseudogalii]
MAAERRSNGPQARVRENFFGRSRGKTLRPHQAGLLREALPDLGLDLAQPAPADLAALFAAPVDGVRLEIGFGGGEHLHHETCRHPGTGFIGVEPFVNSMAKLLAALEDEPRANLRLFGDDATLLLDWLPDACLSGVDLFYPDPWPKRKHWKRRFVNERTLARLARTLRPGAPFRFASDIETYVDWTLRHLRDHPAFEWIAEGPADWRTPYEAWPGTRYEAKAHREGRVGAYLTFRRI